MDMDTAMPMDIHTDSDPDMDKQVQPVTRDGGAADVHASGQGVVVVVKQKKELPSSNRRAQLVDVLELLSEHGGLDQVDGASLVEVCRQARDKVRDLIKLAPWRVQCTAEEFVAVCGSSARLYVRELTVVVTDPVTCLDKWSCINQMPRLTALAVVFKPFHLNPTLDPIGQLIRECAYCYTIQHLSIRLERATCNVPDRYNIDFTPLNYTNIKHLALDLHRHLHIRAYSVSVDDDDFKVRPEKEEVRVLGLGKLHMLETFTHMSAFPVKMDLNKTRLKSLCLGCPCGITFYPMSEESIQVALSQLQVAMIGRAHACPLYGIDDSLLQVRVMGRYQVEILLPQVCGVGGAGGEDAPHDCVFITPGAIQSILEVEAPVAPALRTRVIVERPGVPALEYDLAELQAEHEDEAQRLHEEGVWFAHYEDYHLWHRFIRMFADTHDCSQSKPSTDVVRQLMRFHWGFLSAAAEAVRSADY
eukprot:jgi/Chlat1/5420/Chrsp35S05315